MTGSAVAQFRGRKYISIETYRKTGQGVRTPVWFAEDPERSSRFWVYTEAGSGKVKRIRNNPRIRIAPCDMRGNIEGEWVPASARIVDSDDARRGQQLLNRKYFLKRIGDVVSRLMRHKQAVLVIDIEEKQQ